MQIYQRHTAKSLIQNIKMKQQRELTILHSGQQVIRKSKNKFRNWINV